MLWHRCGVGIGDGAEVFVLPKVANLCNLALADAVELQGDIQVWFFTVEKANSLVSIRQGSRPDFQRPFLPDAAALNSLRILVDGNDLAIREHIPGLWCHGAQIVSGQERRG